MIPILNLYGTGSVLQAVLPELMVTDGCIYVASEIKGPSVILMNGEILRVLFGIRKGDEGRAALYENVLLRIRDDLVNSGIKGVYSKIAAELHIRFNC